MNDNAIMVIVGVKGEGKTTLARKIAREYPRVIVVDTVAQFDEFETCFGWQACTERLMRAETEKAFKLSLRGTSEDELLELCEVIYSFRDVLVIVEEAGMFCSPAMLPRPIFQLVCLGRHRRISQIYTAQRASSLHRNITAQADLIISFRQEEPRDLDYLQDRVGMDAQRVRTLKSHRFIAWGDFSKAPLVVLDRNFRVDTRAK